MGHQDWIVGAMTEPESAADLARAILADPYGISHNDVKRLARLVLTEAEARRIEIEALKTALAHPLIDPDQYVLREELEQVIEALNTYGSHLPNCAAWRGPQRDCSCGFNEDRDGVAEREAKS